MAALDNYWYRPNKLVWLLLPLSWLYCLVVYIRRKLYQLHVIKSFTAQVPVVVVGNIVAGGSGKTPLLIGLCEYVSARGYRPGVVSRGYGGSYSGIRQVSESDDAIIVGDEPLMIKQRAGVPVVVSADRVAAVEYLLDNNDCDIVFSDDGLQHYRMRRNIELAVIDVNRGLGNGFCLPAGPLREKSTRLQEVDMVVYNGKPTDASGVLVQRSGNIQTKCFYQLKITKIQRLNSKECRVLSDFAKTKTHAIAGIGNPSRFFGQLEAEGLSLEQHTFSDHHAYRQDDFSGWSTDCIIMTEKDAVKCRNLILPDAWVVIVSSQFSAALASALDEILMPLMTGSGSARQ